MPVIKSAIKKLKQDKKHEKSNKKIEKKMGETIKKAGRSKSEKTVASAFSAIDKAVKANIIHKNKAARLKSRLVKGKVKTFITAPVPKSKSSKVKK